jgi:hypothetical protein
MKASSRGPFDDIYHILESRLDSSITVQWKESKKPLLNQTHYNIFLSEIHTHTHTSYALAPSIAT